MFTARALARAAPRTMARLSRPYIARPISLRSLPVRSHISAFSTSLMRKASSGTVDSDLSDKLAGEIQFETEMKEGESLPVSIKDFLENGPFELKDTPGMQDVVLTRNYGNEK